MMKFLILALISILNVEQANAAQVSVGSGYILATINGEVWGWGSNHRGQLGLGTTGNIQITPARVYGLTNGVESTSAGFGHSRAIKDEALFWWGFSQCSANNPSCDKWVPTEIEGLQSGVSQVSGSQAYACAIKNGGVWSWGNSCTVSQPWNRHVCPNNICLRPVPLPGLEQGVSSISVGPEVGCAIKNGGLWCWSKGRACLAPLNYGTNPKLIPELTNGVTSVDVSARHLCAVKNGEVWCWGGNESKELGYTGEFSKHPQKVIGLQEVAVSLATGEDQSCAIVENGDVWCWGRVRGEVKAPTKKGGLPGRAVQVSLAKTQSSTMPSACVALEQGEIWCWGAVLSEPGHYPVNYSQPSKIEGLPRENARPVLAQNSSSSEEEETLPFSILDLESAPMDQLDTNNSLGFENLKAADLAWLMGLTPNPVESKADRIQILEATIEGQKEEIANLRAMIRTLLKKSGLPIPEEFQSPAED